jgi:hypothetical protein
VCYVPNVASVPVFSIPDCPFRFLQRLFLKSKALIMLPSHLVLS